MKILIIEDEAMVARRIMRMTQSFFGSALASIDCADSVEEGTAFLKSNAPDLLLLDLNLHGNDGFEVLKQFSAAAFHTIIISAYKEKAIEAFEYGVLDFVPKPFNEERLSQAFLRLTSRQADAGIRYLAIQKRGGQHLIEVAEVDYIKGARIYTELYLADGSTELHNKSLDRLETLLPERFERVHKSYLADMSKVAELLVAGGGKYSLLMKSGTQLPVSRSKYKELKERWFV
mgnify:CR=1 FL=1